MNFKSLFILLFVIVSMNFISCDDSNESDEAARVQLKLVDSEGNYDKVLVNIIDVKYNRNDDDEGWKSFENFQLPVTDDPQNRVDLTELIAGNSLVLTDEEIEAGMFSQIRLVLGDGNAIVLEGETEEIPLTTPSAQESGLKLHVDTNLKAGFSYTFVLDWDVQKSIVKAGTSGNYNLKPVINVTAEVNSGTIMGRIADSVETVEDLLPIENAVITLYSESDTAFSTPITSTYSNSEGLFKFQGLEEGNYLIKVEKTDYTEFYSVETIEVSKGIETDIGTILLVKAV